MAKSKDAKMGNISNVKDAEYMPNPTKHFNLKHLCVTKVVITVEIEKTTVVSMKTC